MLCRLYIFIMLVECTLFLHLFSLCNSPLRTIVCQPTADLTFTCSKTEIKNYPAGLGVNCGQHVDSLAIVGFLDRDYRYRSVSTQIPHDAGLAPITYTGWKFVPIRNWTTAPSHSTIGKHYALYLAAKGRDLIFVMQVNMCISYLQLFNKPTMCNNEI